MAAVCAPSARRPPPTLRGRSVTATPATVALGAKSGSMVSRELAHNPRQFRVRQRPCRCDRMALLSRPARWRDSGRHECRRGGCAGGPWRGLRCSAFALKRRSAPAELTGPGQSSQGWQGDRRRRRDKGCRVQATAPGRQRLTREHTPDCRPVIDRSRRPSRRRQYPPCRWRCSVRGVPRS